jgi:flavodoxin/ferredoxin
VKALIIFFSQTGNTRSIAERIHEGLTRVTDHCDLRSLREVDVASLPEYGLVGIGSPVFYYKEPFNVSDFLEALPDLNRQHWFVFCTHANVIGNFFPSVLDKLERKGARVIGCYNSYASVTVPFYPRPSYTSGHPDGHDLEQAAAFGMEVANRSSDLMNGHGASVNVSYPVSSEEWLQDCTRMTPEYLRQVFPKLRLNTDTCIGCRECEENCPVQGIDIEADPPRVQSPCIYCWQCVNICPTLSMGADWEPFVRMAPSNYARYRKELDKAAARGEFRWLMDPSTIDLHDPLYKQRERQLHVK